MKNPKKMICNAPKKSNHCLTKCGHGVPHDRERERDACHLITELCTAGLGIFKVKCRPATAKEIEDYEETKLKENRNLNG